MLYDWSVSGPDATVQRLYYTLQMLPRPDAAEVLEPFLGETSKETLILWKESQLLLIIIWMGLTHNS